MDWIRTTLHRSCWSTASAWTDSDAIQRVLTGLGGAWRLAGVIAWVPRFVRDPVCRWIARNRYRLFGTTACHVPTEEERARFL